MNRIAPIILVLLLALAGLQLRSSFGGGGVRADQGEVSEADLLEEATTTTLSQRTFVTLVPIEEREPASPQTRRSSPSSTDNAGPTTGSSPTASSTTRPPDTSATIGSSTVTVSSTSPSTTRPSTTRPPTTTGSSTSSTTERPTTTANTTTTERPTTTQTTSGTVTTDDPGPDGP